TFTIDGQPYVGLGLDVDRYEKTDFWVFKLGEAWSEVAPFPGKARYGAVAFSDGQYGYVGLGYAQNLTEGGQIVPEEYFSDFWRFDPSLTTAGIKVVDQDTIDVSYQGGWTKIESVFPGEKRQFAIGFFVGGKGYVGTGSGEGKTGNLNNYWAFDPLTQKWDSEPIIKGKSRQGAVVWVIGNSAYIAGGVQGTSANYINEVLKFTPGQEPAWEELEPWKDLEGRSWDNDYAKIRRSNGVAFVVGKEEDQSVRAYVTLGSVGTAKFDCWEFNPYEGEKGRWDEVTGFPANYGARLNAVAFTMDDVGYVTLGGSSTNSASQSTYKFYPGVKDNEYDDD
ncbi:hypothetical protein LJC12_06035, partial [Odoribacter sp. OttesenSCG-928-J03]|nr:hypothetical protein [Odoribacter sp. OttesenSCG-928-J03]